MSNFNKFYQQIATNRLSHWLTTLPAQLDFWQQNNLHGEFKHWQKTLDALPPAKNGPVDLINSVTVGSSTDLNETFGLVKFIITFIITVVIGFTISDHDERQNSQREGNELTIILGMTALGIAIHGKLSGSEEIFNISIIISSSLLGLLIWSLPKNRFPINSYILIGIGTPVITLGNYLVFNSKTNPISLGLIIIILFLDRIKFLA